MPSHASSFSSAFGFVHVLHLGVGHFTTQILVTFINQKNSKFEDDFCTAMYAHRKSERKMFLFVIAQTITGYERAFSRQQ